MMGETCGGQDGCGLQDDDAVSCLKLVDVLDASVVTGMGTRGPTVGHINHSHVFKHSE